MGGATSVDQAWRTPQINWWPQELPDERHFETARTQLDVCDWQVDYVITHTCANSLLPKALYLGGSIPSEIGSPTSWMS